MTSAAAASVVTWARRVCAKRGAPPHELLELRANATIKQVQDAFHKIAQRAHPDVHRNTLAADELALVTTAYALVAGAYQTLRTRPPEATPAAPPQVAANQILARSVGRSVAPATPPPSAPADAAPQGGPETLSTRAALYFRKAELALKRGDLKGAVLQLKLAIAAESSSTFLRSALAEVEAELKKP